MSKFLVIRFSALGDVAMTVPVIYSFAVQYPHHHITVWSREAFRVLFESMPENVSFIGADLEQRHKGIKGLNRLYKELKKESFDFVIDFHSVLRTQYLILRFKLSGIKTVSIDKGRKEKKALTRKSGKVLLPLKSNFERYKEALEKSGFPFDYSFRSIFGQYPADFSEIVHLSGEKAEKWIGIAPFAKHEEKIYPHALMEQVLVHFASDERYKIFVFGGGEKEKAIVGLWTKQFPGLIPVMGKLSMHQELILMHYLDIMLSMDSANMHLASLTETKVISVWGATHPYAGFMGWRQSANNAIQIDLYCRPCSVFGSKPCYRGDYACLYGISPRTVIKKIEDNL